VEASVRDLAGRNTHDPGEFFVVRLVIHHSPRCEQENVGRYPGRGQALLAGGGFGVLRLQ
jgi:hypothetical protein